MKRGWIRGVTALLAGLVAGTGCATIGTMQTADTVGEGGFELGVEPSFWGVSAGGNGGGMIQLGISGRFGISDRTDLGFRVGTNGGAELLTKFALTNPASPGIKLALAPSGGGIVMAAGGGAAGLLHFQVPLIIGVPLGESQFVLAPKVHQYLIFAAGGGDGAGGSFTSAGASVGFSLAVSDNVRLLPEFAAVMPMVASGSISGLGSETEVLAGDGMFYQVSFGFLIGGRDKVAKAE